MADLYGFNTPLSSGLTGPRIYPPTPAPAAPPLAAPTIAPSLPPLVPRAAPFWAQGVPERPDFEPTPLPPTASGLAAVPTAPAMPASPWGPAARQLTPTIGAPLATFGAGVSPVPDRAPAAPATVDPSKIVTGRPQAPQGQPGGASAGPDYLTQWNNIVDAQKAALLATPRGGGAVRPKAPEPLLRMAGLQNEAGKIDSALATFDRDLSYRKADNAGDLVAEQEAGVKRLEQFDQDAQTRMAAARQRLDDVTAKLSTGDYDPDRLWHKASAGRQAGFQAAAILSGIGQSIAGRGGQQNGAMQSLFALMDRDNANQIEQINQGRQRASDAAKLYRDVVEQTGSDRAAVHALNLAKLDALRSRFDAEYQQLAAKMPIAGTQIDLQQGAPYVVDAQGKPLTSAKIDKQGRPVDGRTGRPIPGATVQIPTTGTGQPIATTALDLRLQQARNAIDQRRAQEDLAMQQAIAAATKPVGGGGMTREQQLAKLAALTKGQVEAQRDAAKDAAAAGKDTTAVFTRGQKYQIDPNVPKELAAKYQERINFAETGLATLDALEKNVANAPVMGTLEKGARLVGADRIANALGDEQRNLGASQLAGMLAQLGGSGVPSAPQEQLAREAFSGGPGAAKAIAEARRQINSGKQIALQNLGVK